jgi:hypothetical protein
VAKRSPILGYNHNVKYRGIVFHVQTEDSGLGSPHLFTHLFHEGVIVSTRKLVYDPGANEEAIKALMQAQHKAVMKDLMKGTFDEKIDQYLGGVTGLEPSSHGSKVPASGRGDRAPTEVAPPPPEAIIDQPTEHTPMPLAPPEDLDAGVPLETLPAGDHSVPIELTVPKPRTSTGQKLPPPPMEYAETVSDPTGSIAAAVAAANSGGKAQPQPRAATPPPDAEPVLELELSEESQRARLPRDTNVESVTITPRQRTTGDAVPRPADSGGSQPAARRTPTGDRPASQAAAALPPMKAPSRPQVTPNRPPTGETPAVTERAAGTYSMGRARPPSDSVPLREKTGRIAAINPNPGRPATATPVSRVQPPATPPTGTPVARQGTAPITARDAAQMRPGAGAKPVTPPSGVPERTTPAVTAPIVNRATPAAGVVMSRPAVIVGAPPAKSAAPPTPSRVRKAREDEGRGFGSGLISEKSLDEVILAYLSEDAEDK